jgi:CSLREA domain-containing protein
MKWLLLTTICTALVIVTLNRSVIVSGEADYINEAHFVVDSVVDAVDANPGDDICATAAGECTLRAAVQESNASPGTKTIFIPSGTYIRTIGGVGGNDSVGDLNITANVIIFGQDRDTTIIDANLLDRVFMVESGAHASLSSITIRRGLTAGLGGGIYVESGASATVDGVTVIGNSGGGGGIHARGPLTVTNSIIATNQAANDQSGGGILAFDTNLVIMDSTIRDNTAASRGAGLFLQDPGSAKLVNVTVSGNESAGEGGGITNLGMALSLLNVTISGNQAVLGGAALDNHGVTTITNTTVFNNSSVTGIGGLYNNPINNGTINVVNTIVAANGGGNCGGTVSGIVSSGNNIDSETSCNFLSSGDLSNADPLLGALDENGGPTLTHWLLTGSPAIDAGSNQACPLRDQRGNRRPLDGTGDGVAICDIGAVEVGDDFSIYLPIVSKE